MDIAKIEEMLVQSTADLKEAKVAYFEAQERTIAAKIGLEAAKVAAVQMGAINGSNDKIRNAQEAEYCANFISGVQITEREERRAKFAVEQYQATYDLAGKLLRIAEVTAQMASIEKPPI